MNRCRKRTAQARAATIQRRAERRAKYAITRHPRVIRDAR